MAGMNCCDLLMGLIGETAMYIFKKYGALMYYKGVPVYAGTECITPRHLVWWWPLNWLVFLIGTPVAVYRLLKNRKAH